MPSVLLVENNPIQRRSTAGNLSAFGYQVTVCGDARSATREFSDRGSDFDICVIDTLLPGPDGLALTRIIRTFDTVVPIILLAEAASQHSFTDIFGCGADTYLKKPLNHTLLAHAIKPWLARTKKLAADAPTVIRIGSWRLECNEMMLVNGESGTAIRLTAKMVALLRMFAERQGELLSREELLRQVWGQVDHFLGRSMDVFICKIRGFFSQDQQIEIVNQPGKGFMLEVRQWPVS